MSTAAETGVLLAAAATVDEGPLRLRNKRDESDLTAKEARRLHPEAAPSAPAAAADGEPPVPGARVATARGRRRRAAEQAQAG